MHTIPLIILGILFAIISWKDLRFGLFLIAAFLPAYLLRFTIGPSPFTVLELMILLAFAVWIIRWRSRATLGVAGRRLNNGWN